MKMDQSSGNFVTQFFAWFAAIAAACGVTTQDMVYMLFGLIGVLISFASFVSGRLDARKARKENEKRTRIVSDYLDEARAKPAHEKPAAAKVISEALSKAEV
jgi:hypothetical protein